jgi:hypothetical protein
LEKSGVPPGRTSGSGTCRLSGAFSTMTILPAETTGS